MNGRAWRGMAWHAKSPRMAPLPLAGPYPSPQRRGNSKGYDHDYDDKSHGHKTNDDLTDVIRNAYYEAKSTLPYIYIYICLCPEGLGNGMTMRFLSANLPRHANMDTLASVDTCPVLVHTEVPREASAEWCGVMNPQTNIIVREYLYSDTRTCTCIAPTTTIYTYIYIYILFFFAVPLLQQQKVTICPGWGRLGNENCKQFGQNCWRGGQDGWSPSEDRNQKCRGLEEAG